MGPARADEGGGGTGGEVILRPRPAALLVSTIPETLDAFWIPLRNRLGDRGWRVDGMAAGIGDHGVAARLDGVVDIAWSRRPAEALARLPWALPRIRRAIEHGGYDVVQVQTPVAGFTTRLAIATIPAHRRPAVIYSVHGFHFHPLGSRLGNMAARSLESVASRWTDFLVVTHEHDRREAVGLGIPSDRVLHVPGVGVDTAHFSPDRVPGEAVAAVHASIGLAPGTPFVVCVAELNRNKRQEDVVRAVARMQRRDVHLVLRGSGPLEADLRSTAAHLGVADRVHVVPRVADLRPLLLASAATVLASRREGLPVSLIEALSLGVPAVGTDIRGIRELLGNGRGRLTPPGDVAALSDALDEVVCRPPTVARTEAVRRHVAEHHGLDLVLGMYEEIYERGLALRAATSSRSRTS